MIMMSIAVLLTALSIASRGETDDRLKGLMLDGQGNIVYDAAGFAVLEAYPEMCGGKDADEECYECFECNDQQTRCVPIADCVPHCEADDDCTREQICLADEKICQLPGGPPKDYKRGGKGGKGGKGRGGGGGGPMAFELSKKHAKKSSKKNGASIEMARQASTSEILLVICLCVGVLVTLWHCYKWCIHNKLGRQFQVLEEQDTATPSHCVIDGQAFY